MWMIGTSLVSFYFEAHVTPRIPLSYSWSRCSWQLKKKGIPESVKTCWRRLDYGLELIQLLKVIVGLKTKNSVRENWSVCAFVLHSLWISFSTRTMWMKTCFLVWMRRRKKRMRSGRGEGDETDSSQRTAAVNIQPEWKLVSQHPQDTDVMLYWNDAVILPIGSSTCLCGKSIQFI